MNFFRPYIPDFDRNFVVEMCFRTTEDLLFSSYVSEFCTLPGFCYYCLSDELLLAVYNDGYSWYVIGSIQDPVTIELPQWVGKYKGENENGDVIDVCSDEILSICNNIITLKNNTCLKQVPVVAFC